MLYHKSSFTFMIFFLFFNYNIWRHVIHTRTALKRQQGWDFISFAFLLPAQFSNTATADLASPAQPSGTAVHDCQLPKKPWAPTWAPHFLSEAICSTGLAGLHRKEEKLPGGTFLQCKPPNPNSSQVPEEAKAATQFELPLPFLLYHPQVFSSAFSAVCYHLPNSSLIFLYRPL